MNQPDERTEDFSEFSDELSDEALDSAREQLMCYCASRRS